MENNTPEEATPMIGKGLRPIFTKGATIKPDKDNAKNGGISLSPEDKSSGGVVIVERDAINQKQFHQMFEYEPQKIGLMAFSNHWKHKSNGENSGFMSVMSQKFQDRPNFNCLAFLYQIIPILEWLPKYKWKEDLVNDCIAGFTIAVMHVPQGLAYGMLAQVDAICGIYTAFFPVLIYTLLGTSRHLSMGTFAVVSILVSKPAIELCQNNPNNSTLLAANSSFEIPGNFSFEDILANSSTGGESQLKCQIKVTVAVTFLAGIIQLCMGLMRLGVLSALLSESLISGFTTGAAFHVVTTQVPHIFGFRIQKFIGPGRLVKCYIAIFQKLAESNLVAIGITVASILILVIYEFKLKQIVAKKCRFPIPVQFIVVVLGTLTAWLLNLNQDHGMIVVGEVPTGVPAPYIPFLDLELLQNVFLDALGVAIISYVISLSMARIVALKLKYQVDANQELIAQGISNIFGSFFQSLPFAASMARTMVQVTSGGRTQLASAVSAGLLLCVILFIGPLFFHLPRATLSAIIVVSLISIFLQIRDFFRYAKRSLSEAFVWLATFLFTVFLDVDLGLLVGLAVSLLFLIAWGYFPKIEVIGLTQHQDLFLEEGSFKQGTYFGDVIAIRISGNLNMANATSLSNRIASVLNEHFPHHSWADGKCKSLILDISSVTHVDTVACQDIIAVYQHFHQVGLTISLVGVRAEVWSRFKVCTVFETIPEERCFPTLQDALAQSKQIITLQDTLSHSKQVIKNEDLECEQEQ